MFDYSVRDVVCDYGLFRGDELLIIFNSRKIALAVLEFIRADNLGKI